MLVFLVNGDIMMLFLTGGVSLGAGPSSKGTSTGRATDDKYLMSDGSKTIILE